MIIDIHTHLAFHAVYPRAFVSALLSGGGVDPDSDVLPSIVKRWLSDQTGSRLVGEMDKAGIATSVLLMIDGGLRYGEEEHALESSYAVHRALLERWPERFVVFGGADPRRGPAALELFRRSVTEWGFGGLKIYPPMGFSPADRALDPYLDICAELGLPVMTHSGDSSPSLDNDFAHPRFVAELARRRPEITVIMAHGGYALADPDVRRAVELPNVRVDLAGFQVRESALGWDAVIPELAWIFSSEFNERVLFGSDYPLFHFSKSLEHDVGRIRAVFEAAADGDQQKLDNVLWRNAQRILARPGAAAPPVS